MKLLNKLHKMILFCFNPKISNAFQWKYVPLFYKSLRKINFILFWKYIIFRVPDFRN